MNRERPPSSARRRAWGRSRFIVEDSENRQSQLAIQAQSTRDLTTVLGGVKGSLAALGGFAALDPACAPWGTYLCRRRQEKGNSEGVGLVDRRAAGLSSRVAIVTFGAALTDFS